jgi:hypothetical protein
MLYFTFIMAKDLEEPMSIRRLSRRAFVAATLAGAIAPSLALAHHGWAWTEDQPFKLTGIVEEVYIGHPHVTMKVRAEDGVWDVDLAPLAASQRAGFDDGAVKVGDEVTCVGYRARDHNERHMKAARVIVGDKTYDVYPTRVPSI